MQYIDKKLKNLTCKILMSSFPRDYNLWPRVEVYGADFRSCLLDMATTITKISNGLQDNSHSGVTFSYCMRCMEYIAKNGFTAFHKLHSEAN